MPWGRAGPDMDCAPPSRTGRCRAGGRVQSWGTRGHADLKAGHGDRGAARGGAGCWPQGPGRAGRAPFPPGLAVGCSRLARVWEESGPGRGAEGAPGPLLRNQGPGSAPPSALGLGRTAGLRVPPSALLGLFKSRSRPCLLPRPEAASCSSGAGGVPAREDPRVRPGTRLLPGGTDPPRTLVPTVPGAVLLVNPERRAGSAGAGRALTCLLP